MTPAQKAAAEKEAADKAATDAAAKEAADKAAAVEQTKREEREAADRRKSPSLVERAVAKFNVEFCRDLPQSARGGGFEPGDDPRFAGEFDVPDGVYRVAGGEWLHTFKGGRYTGSARATEANRWGGDKVVSVNG